MITGTSVAEREKQQEITQYDPAAVEARKEILIRSSMCKSILESKLLPKSIKNVNQVNALWVMAEARGMNVVEAICGGAIYATDDGQVGYYAAFMAAEIEKMYGPGCFRLLPAECNTVQAVCEYRQPGWNDTQRLTARIKQQSDPATPPPGVLYVPIRLLNNFGWKGEPQNQLKRWLTRKVAKDAFPRVLFGEHEGKSAYAMNINVEMPEPTKGQKAIAQVEQEAMAEAASSEAPAQDAELEAESIEGEWQSFETDGVPDHIDPETGEIHDKPEDNQRLINIAILLDFTDQNPNAKESKAIERSAASFDSITDYLEGLSSSSLATMVERLPRGIAI